MEPRLILAYGSIAVMAASVIGLVFHRLYHSERRTYARRQLRDKAAHARRTAEQENPGG